ncbi:MAG: murein biosynthesis integral membrane protein MurJ [Elusimicrobiaceae bacterium]|nr:murein biosynthesis integral membrane protein MurJ [Elusimicrobiaceae bacterium]
MDIRSTARDEKFAENAGAFGAATAVSRVLGYLRDAGIMYLFGATALTDAYYAALRIANFFRRTAGEGTINAAFMPLLAQENAVSRARGHEFFAAVWTAGLAATAFFSLLAAVFAAPLVRALTWGLCGQPEIFGLTVTLTRIMMAQVIFVMLSALCQGALYLSMRFFLPAIAPVTFSLSIIVYLIAAAALPGPDPETRVRGLALAAVAGSALQLALLAPAVKKLGYSLRLTNPLRTPAVKTALAMMLPALVCSAGDQISMFTGMFFASFLPQGSITAIYNSARIMQLPLALFGVAAANSALAHLTVSAQSGDRAEFRSTYSLAVRLTGFMLIPAMAGILVLDLPLVRALFEHGRFSFEQSEVTASALRWLGPGLAAHGVNKISVMAFYALKDWKTPFKIILAQTAVEIALCMALLGKMGVAGLALASSAGAWSGALLLTLALRKKFGPLGFAGILRAYARFILLAGAMAGLCAMALHYAQPLGTALAAACAVCAGAAGYAGLALAFNTGEAKLFLAAGKNRENTR